MCAKCKGKGLCPVSFGIAVGVTSALAMFVWSFWGVPVPGVMWINGVLLALVKGFIFGLIVALIYDLCICCKCRFRKCDDTGTCGCGCGCKCGMGGEAKKL